MKWILSKGLSFSPGSVKYIITKGLSTLQPLIEKIRDLYISRAKTNFYESPGKTNFYVSPGKTNFYESE